MGVALPDEGSRKSFKKKPTWGGCMVYGLCVSVIFMTTTWSIHYMCDMQASGLVAVQILHVQSLKHE